MILRKSSIHGFTLIELMIVVAAIAIITAIALPSYSSYIMKSRRADAKNALLDLASRQERYFSVNNKYTSNAALLGYGPTGTNFPFPVNSSGNSYYQLTVSNATGSTSTTQAGYKAQATPIGSQRDDATCYAYQVTQSGEQTNIDGSGTVLPGTGCW